MIIFNTDLDNTLIYSYKHDIGENKICVEIYQNREISFITETTSELLYEVNKRVVLVPTTTRTIEQYRRIDLGIGIPRYALVCNGGVLLVDGEEDAEWYQDSLAMVEDCQKELTKAVQLLQVDKNIKFEIRNIMELFIFTKSGKPYDTMYQLKDKLDKNLVDVFNNGEKVYVVPKKMNKGISIERLKEKLGADYVIAAGDSEFDIPMLKRADFSLVPRELADKVPFARKTVVMEGNDIFAEYALKNVIQYVDGNR